MENLEVEKHSQVSESPEYKASDINKNEKNSTDKMSNLAMCKETNSEGISESSQSAISSSPVHISSINKNERNSTGKVSNLAMSSVRNSEGISERSQSSISSSPFRFFSLNDRFPMVDMPHNEMPVPEEISDLVSEACDKIEIITNNIFANYPDVDNSDSELHITNLDYEVIPVAFAVVNDDLYDAEISDDDDDTNNNESLTNTEIKNISELLECNTEDKISEMNEESTNSFVERDAKDRGPKKRHWTEQASLPYYREPKPNFFEYIRKMQEELDLKPSIISSPSVPNSSTHTIVLDEPVDRSIEEPSCIKTSTSVDTCLEKRKGISSEKPASGLIILDDYKSPRVKNSHFSRSNDFWNLSSLNSTKEKPEPVPGSKYKALKEQLMEKIMLKKEESLNKRKEEQEFDEEHFEEEEEVVSDETPNESENGSSDDDMEDNSPENIEDDVVLKDMLLKECEKFSDSVLGENEDSNHVKNSEMERVINTGTIISEDSEEPMECYSLPSYQPGGGFAKSPLQKNSVKRIFSDSDFNDSALNSSSFQRSKGRIFSDSDFNDSAPSESSGPSQVVNTPSLKFRDETDEQLPFEGSDEQIIPHWDSLPASEKQGSQLFDEDISIICSGKFPSTNEEIPWTPSSSAKNCFPDKESITSLSNSNHINNEGDQLIESDDEELVRPAKKIKLSLVEKLWDSEDENDGDSEHPLEQNGKLEKYHHKIHSDSDDDDAVQHEEPGANSDEEDNDLSETSEQINDSVEEPHFKNDDKGSAKKLEIKNFFENEAELSGEEGSSDENEDDMDEYMEDELITNEIVASEEKLRKEVGIIHFKRQQDEDDQLIRQLKNDFLPEGELYNENGQRKRRFIWNNIGTDDTEFTETKSDSEEEEIESLPTDYLKWQQEKNKSNLPDDDDDEVQTPKSTGLKVDIIGKVSVTRYSSGSNSSISASPALRRGSFLNSSIGKNMKFIKEFNSSEGSVSRKNFVFSSPQPNVSLPSTPTLEIKSTRVINSISDRSIFNKI